MKKPAINLAILSVTSVLLIIGLFVFAEDVNRRENGFIRLFPPHPILPESTLDLKYNSYYIAGASTDRIYLGNHTAPLIMYSANMNLSDTLKVRLTITDLDKLKLQRIQLTVDSPYFYFKDGIKPALLRGKLSDLTADRFMFDSAYFTEAVPIGPSSFALQAVNRKNNYVLGKETNKAPFITLKETILKKQIDGLFCVDGNLSYNRHLNELMYVYHYRNQYIRLDTGLNIISLGRTIDTTSVAKIQTSLIKSENSVTMSAPPLLVNKSHCTWNDYLFVQSNLRASNESKTMFESGEVIDVYNIRNGEYKFSFYLHQQGEDKAREFKVYNGKIFALYGNYILTYSLSPKFFPTENRDRQPNI